MTEYKVKWEIDIEAESPREAAKEALKIQRDENSIASAFEVENKETGEVTKILEVEAYCADCGQLIEGEPIYWMGTSARCEACHKKRMKEE